MAISCKCSVSESMSLVNVLMLLVLVGANFSPLFRSDSSLLDRVAGGMTMTLRKSCLVLFSLLSL